MHDNLLPLKLKQKSKASSYAVYGSWNETCILKTMHHEVGKTSKNPRKIHIKCSKCSGYVDFTQMFGKNLRISTIFGTKIQNHLSSRSAQLETVYIEALLYPFKGIFVIDLIQKYHPFWCYVADHILSNCNKTHLQKVICQLLSWINASIHNWRPITEPLWLHWQ